MVTKLISFIVMLNTLYYPVKEHLLYPDFGVVALYKKRVIGCALMNPEAYISYITVLPTCEKAGIARFMLYYLIKVRFIRGYVDVYI
jgi:ribosomal protein S18 acetylase RimI-like enzyme